MWISSDHQSGTAELRVVFRGPSPFIREWLTLLLNSPHKLDLAMIESSNHLVVSPTPTPETTSCPAATRSAAPTPPPADEPE